MSGMKGYFEKGRWIEDRDPAPGSEPATEASRSVTGDIERAAREAAENLERAVHEWAASARFALRKF